MHISASGNRYCTGESKLRELILNVCQQRNLGRSAELPSTAENRYDYAAGMLTLVDKMSTDQETGVFTGTMRFCYKGTVFLTAAYTGFTNQIVTNDLRRLLNSGNTSLPFRGTNRRLRYTQDNTMSVAYSLRALGGGNYGSKSFCKPDGRYISLEDRVVLKDGRSVGEEVHHCTLHGQIQISAQEMRELVLQPELL